MIRLYHNPRCSKSRAALELLRQREAEVEVIEYLQTPPSAAELEQLLARLGMEPRQLLRRSEEEYGTLQLDNPELDRAQLIAIMVQHPRLIERPIAVDGERAVVGRPPERVLELLS